MTTKIVHVITGLGTGGAERALYTLLAAGLASRFENTVVSLTDEGTYGKLIRQLGVQVLSLNMTSSRSLLGSLVRLRRVIHDTSADVVQGWMYHGDLAATLGAFRIRHCAKLVWNIRHSLYDVGHEKFFTGAAIKALKYLSSNPQVVVYNSAKSRCLHEAFGFRSQRGQVIPNGFDLQQWQPNSLLRADLRRMLGVPEAALIVGHIARYHPQKDHATYLRALQTVSDRHPEVHFLIVGLQVNTENPALASLFAALPSCRLHILGERHDIERLMPALDVYCLSSSTEAFPNVLGEAMACAIPCVTTDVGDAAIIVADTGVVVPPMNASMLAEGLSQMLSRTAHERRLLGKAARERVRARYSLEFSVQQYVEMYTKLSAQSANDR